MNQSATQKKPTQMHRVNTRIFAHQDEFIKNEVKKSKGALTEGEVTRQLLDEAIISRKNNES